MAGIVILFFERLISSLIWRSSSTGNEKAKNLLPFSLYSALAGILSYDIRLYSSQIFVRYNKPIDEHAISKPVIMRTDIFSLNKKTDASVPINITERFNTGNTKEPS